MHTTITTATLRRLPPTQTLWIIIFVLYIFAGRTFTQITSESPLRTDVSGSSSSSNNNNNNNSSISISISSNPQPPKQQQPPTAPPLKIDFQTEHPIILLDLKIKKSIKMNYTLQCDHPSSVYIVMAKSITEDVATIIGGNPVTIACFTGNISKNGNGNKMAPYSVSQANDKTPKDVVVEPKQNTDNAKGEKATNNTLNPTFDVFGEFEMKFESHTIGRSFFLMFATKISGPGAQIPPGMGKPKTPNNKNNNTNLVQHNRPKRSSQTQNTQNQTDVAKTTQQRRPSGGGNSKAAGGLPHNTVVKSMIIVMQMPRAIDEIFRIILYIVIISATIGMGIKVETEVIIEVMKKPLGPCIGLFCQYVCMPLIAYVVALSVPQRSAAISLGIFTCGIVPGGGASNFWCYLLGGDVTLSVTMTTISSIAALGLIPMWLFTLGENFKDDTVDVHVPYPKILETLSIVLLPVFAGMIIKKKLPKVAKIISKILKPFLIIIVLFLLAIGIYANYFIFSMIRPMQIVAGCLLPYVGYVMGGGIALLTCRKWEHVKTIAIETGIQNTGIAFMILYFTLPPPDNQLAVVAPAASALMTPLPLLVVTFFYQFYLRHQRKKEKANGTLIDDKEQQLDSKDEKSRTDNKNGKKPKDISFYDDSKPSLWDKILGRRSDKEVAEMEKHLNQDLLVEEKDGRYLRESSVDDQVRS